MRARRQYVAMLFATATITAILLIIITVFPPKSPYVHLLVDYHFGFVRRALVGQIVSFFLPRVSQFATSALGVAAVLIAGALYAILFRKDFGFTERNLPLLAFVVGSPFTLKFFVRLLGYFDVYGCIVAICALLLSVSNVYPAILAIMCVALILTHHIHFLLYVPTVGFIFALRYCVERNRYGAVQIAYAIGFAAVVIAAFLVVLRFGTPQVPQDVFLRHMSGRALDSFDADRVTMWYRTIPEEVRDTRLFLGSQLIYVPIYIGLLVIHRPMITFFRATLAAVKQRPHQIIAYGGLLGISVGYVAICFVVFDYNRWLSNWAVCMLLAIHAIRRLPSNPIIGAPIEPEASHNVLFGWLVTLYAFGGPIYPFILR